MLSNWRGNQQLNSKDRKQFKDGRMCPFWKNKFQIQKVTQASKVFSRSMDLDIMLRTQLQLHLLIRANRLINSHPNRLFFIILRWTTTISKLHNNWPTKVFNETNPLVKLPPSTDQCQRWTDLLKLKSRKNSENGQIQKIVGLL